MPETQPQSGLVSSPSAEIPSVLLTAEDLAERWQVSKAQVYRLARGGRLPMVAIGRYYRFRPAAIQAWELEQEGQVG